jgi:head-tail adaptor
MRAGLLKNHIQILTKSIIRDEYGSEKESWDILHAVRADVRYKN